MVDCRVEISLEAIKKYMEKNHYISLYFSPQWTSQGEIKKGYVGTKYWDMGRSRMTEQENVKKIDAKFIKQEYPKENITNCGAKSETEFGGWCSNCNSKNLEVWLEGLHYTCSECPKCHKVRDIKYHDVPSGEAERLRRLAKQN
ncbi:10194_t:CDS:2 [Entrophospora sp. SA101]|nr:10194_t:CDS:2 [Entrophospora sp. SA101]